MSRRVSYGNASNAVVRSSQEIGTKAQDKGVAQPYVAVERRVDVAAALCVSHTRRALTRERGSSRKQIQTVTEKQFVSRLKVSADTTVIENNWRP
jgi:hypothetical protein